MFAAVYSQKASVQTVFRVCSGTDEVAIRLLKTVDAQEFRIFRLMDKEEIPRWSSCDVVSLSDACHSVSPLGSQRR